MCTISPWGAATRGALVMGCIGWSPYIPAPTYYFKGVLCLTRSNLHGWIIQQSLFLFKN